MNCEPARIGYMRKMSDPLSHKENVVCRVCEKKMLARNYKRHLLDHHHKGENPSDLRGKTQRPVNQFFAPRNSKLKKVDSSDEDDPDNDVADSVTGNNVVVDTATLTDNEDDLPEIDARATNTNEVVVAPGPGSSNQLITARTRDWWGKEHL